MTQIDLCLAYAESAFRSVIGEPHPFGSPSGPNCGFSDGNQGVQWNVDIDRDTCTAKLGVNLEGLKYLNWPIALFIEHELEHHQLITLCQKIEGSSKISVCFYRDAWQAASRPPIDEKVIGDIRLHKLTESRWDDMLRIAHQCLNADKGYRGRATQWVTLKKSGRRLKQVSPHLHIYTRLWNEIPSSPKGAKKLLQDGVGLLSQVYDFVENSSTSP